MCRERPAGWSWVRVRPFRHINGDFGSRPLDPGVAVGVGIRPETADQRQHLGAGVAHHLLARLRSSRSAATSRLAAPLLRALTICVRAVGRRRGFGEVVFISTAVSLLAGSLPIPGGIGVTEAGLTGGLMAVGVPETTAMAAVIIYRMCTFSAVAHQPQLPVGAPDSRGRRTGLECAEQGADLLGRVCCAQGQLPSGPGLSSAHQVVERSAARHAL
jgi:hypothetical protein